MTALTRQTACMRAAHPAGEELREPCRFLLEPLYQSVASTVESPVSIPFRISEEDYLRSRQELDAQLARHPSCIELTPAHQFALMQVRQGELSKAIVEKLMHSTVRPKPSDFLELIDMGLIRRTPSWYAITPRGLHRAGMVARDLADSLGIRIKTNRKTPGSFQRQWYTYSATW